MRFSIFGSELVAINATIAMISLVSSKKELLHIENNKKDGLSSVTWQSRIGLRGFLEGADEYFDLLDPKFKVGDVGRLGIFTSNRTPELYEFARPLTFEELEQETVFLGDDQHSLPVFRMETSVGDLVYEPTEQRIGVIEYLNLAEDAQTLQAIANFATRTSSLLTVPMVLKTLSFIPYQRKIAPAIHQSDIE